MAARRGGPQDARETILGRWAVCWQVSDWPELDDIDAIRAAPFDYPHGRIAALGCKAARRLGGQAAHWDMFDCLQRAHLTEARNIANPEQMRHAARALGFEAAALAKVFDDPATAQAVESDRQHACSLQVRSIPMLILRETGACLVNGPREDLAAHRSPPRRLKGIPMTRTSHSKAACLRRRIPCGVPRDLPP